MSNSHAAFENQTRFLTSLALQLCSAFLSAKITISQKRSTT